MAKIVVDPVTRIEGHLRIEAQVEGGRIAEAWSSGTMFRGLELILKGRDPREAWLWSQRICNVCTMVHAIASVRAVENALGIDVPVNARIIRNIIGAAQLIQDHDQMPARPAVGRDPQRGERRPQQQQPAGGAVPADEVEVERPAGAARCFAGRLLEPG